MWSIHAFAKLGDGDKAVELFDLLNPINHARNATEVGRYKVEPYVVAADVYSVAPHAGRGGWTWYTGAAGWMYRAGIEAILGIRREGDVLIVSPCIPREWPGFEATVKVGGTEVSIKVENPRKVEHTTIANGSAGANGSALDTMLDGANWLGDLRTIRIPLDGVPHTLIMRLVEILKNQPPHPVDAKEEPLPGVREGA